jgi:glycosyltransferase involved in cell wall biosynthesis
MWANSANKFFDGLAAGRPIAINYRGWQAELVAKYGNGLVLDNDNIKLSADALNNIVLNVNTLSQMRNSSLSLAKNQYSRDLMAKKLEFCLIQAKKINST